MEYWEKYLSRKRFGKEQEDSEQIQSRRNSFARDFDRVVFSTPFRRLQNKTQVVPLPEKDFIHTRLTHSLEASCIGRSLGRNIGQVIIESDPDYFNSIQITEWDFESLVAAACLVHDIGNPPFGHSGEKAISEFFRSGPGSNIIEGMPDNLRSDFHNFEGNAMGFRLLTYALPAQTQITGGLGLTYGTLGAFTKYPRESTGNLPGEGASSKKYGYFQAEKESFRAVARELALLPKKGQGFTGWHRHPLAFLVEVADDICYLIIDLEDGYKRGSVTFDEIYDCYADVLGRSSMKKTERKIDRIHDAHEKIGYLRAKVISKLIESASNTFLSKLENIVSGAFDNELKKEIPEWEALKNINILSRDKVYQAEDIIEIEAAGYEVIHGLLDIYTKALDGTRSQDERIRRLIPEQYLGIGGKNLPDKYMGLLNIVQYVAGMTDSHALELYRKFKGVSL